MRLTLITQNSPHKLVTKLFIYQAAALPLVPSRKTPAGALFGEGRARAILRQHPALLENLDGVISSLESATEHSESWTAAGKAYEAFACQMAAHEQRENAVIQEGYCEDLGLAE